MLDSGNDKPGVEEQYQAAASTSNLRVEADRRGSGDVLIAAGWSPSRTGMALLRLHSEWDRAAKPRRLTVAQIEEIAATRRDSRGKPNIAWARSEAAVWYIRELRLLAVGLRSRASVWVALSSWLEGKTIHPDTVAAALLHWLHPSCTVCDGHGLRKVEGQPALSARRCHRCHGTGHVPHPEGSAVVLAYLDDCVAVARTKMKQRLRGNHADNEKP